MAAHISIKGRQMSAHRMIQRWGGIGYLIRNGVQRVATMARMEYAPKERGLFLDKSANIRVSMIGLATIPDYEQDEILYMGERYRILLPVTGPKVTDVFVYCDCNSIYTRVAANDTDPSTT